MKIFGYILIAIPFITLFTMLVQLRGVAVTLIALIVGLSFAAMVVIGVKLVSR